MDVIPSNEFDAVDSIDLWWKNKDYRRPNQHERKASDCMHNVYSSSKDADTDKKNLQKQSPKDQKTHLIFITVKPTSLFFVARFCCVG